MFLWTKVQANYRTVSSELLRLNIECYWVSYWEYPQAAPQKNISKCGIKNYQVKMFQFWKQVGTAKINCLANFTTTRRDSKRINKKTPAILPDRRPVHHRISSRWTRKSQSRRFSLKKRTPIPALLAEKLTVRKNPATDKKCLSTALARISACPNGSADWDWRTPHNRSTTWTREAATKSELPRIKETLSTKCCGKFVIGKTTMVIRK